MTIFLPRERMLISDEEISEKYLISLKDDLFSTLIYLVCIKRVTDNKTIFRHAAI